jgi:AcrR family transcriptional regulator
MGKLPTRQNSDSRQALLIAARTVFAEKGLDGATVKDLSDEARVNVSLVSYYFGGKEGLYRECLVNFAEERWPAIIRILKPAGSHEELRTRLQMLGEEITDVHICEPELCRIIHRDIQTLTPAVVEIFRGGFFKIFEALVSFLKAAEKKRLIRVLKNPDVTASLVLGSLMHLLQSDPHRKVLGRPSIRDSKYRTNALEEWLEFTYLGLICQSPATEDRK